MKQIVAVVDWYGPYSEKDASKASSEFKDGVYAAVGKTKYGRTSHLQYIGLASVLKSRMNGQHHKIPSVTRDLQIWLGEIASPRTPGRKLKVTDRMLDLVEWAHTYFLQLPLNDRKTINPPDNAVTVYNRWWQTDFETSHKRRPHKEWPDLIDFIDDESDAKVVWFGGKQIVQSVDKFKSKQ